MKYLLIAAIILVHEAPSGWQYPSDCCSGRDCREVPCEQITRLNTVYRYRTSASIYLDFPENKHRYSGDGRCHVCILGSQRSPTCIFTPIPAGV
jgi:hypothetical protein